VRGLIVLVGLLLLLGGGAVVGAQFAPIDLSALQFLDSIPQAREFLTEHIVAKDPQTGLMRSMPMALYAGGGAAGVGLLLIIVSAMSGGKRTRRKVLVKATSMERDAGNPASRKVAPKAAPPEEAPSPIPQPLMAKAPKGPPPIAPTAAKPAPAAAAPAPPPKPATPITPPPIAAAPAPPKPAAPQPAAAAPAPPRPAAPQPAAAAPAQPRPAASQPAAGAPTPRPVAATSAAPSAKPQASGQPPAATGAPPPDPRLVNRKRVQDLVTINDALTGYYAKHGAYPKADGLAGANERGAAWIPGLSPEFLASIPRDPLHGAGTQYVYVSDGANYKLLAQGASLVGGGNVEVLGIKIDPTRNPTQQNASFGFWTPPFAKA
jgi:hypothetical protein